MLLKLLLVGMGGFVGANLRYLTSLALKNSNFPLATFVVNIVGCFGLALFITILDQRLTLAPNLRLLIGTGFIGALTTFSTFSFEAINLIERGDWLVGVAYIMFSLVLGLGMTIAGLWVGSYL